MKNIHQDDVDDNKVINFFYKINPCSRLKKIRHFDPYGAMGSGNMGCGILSGLALCPQRRYSHWYFDNGLVTMALLPAAF